MPEGKANGEALHSPANYCHLQEGSDHRSWEVKHTVSTNGFAATHLLHYILPQI
jgi:hypothetical protein